MSTRAIADMPAHPPTLSARRWQIVQEVQRKQQVGVAELSQRLGVSENSIRRDLAYLEDVGLVQRTHGGAQAVLRAGQTAPFDVRLLQHVDVKRAIGRVAVDLITAGDVVFLDAGTTVFETARQIPPALLEDGGLTIVTRSLRIAAFLGDQRGLRLIVLGGVYVHDFDTFVGPQVASALRNLHVDKMFLGIDGATIRHGLTTDNALEADLYPLLTRVADRIIIVSDSSKIGSNKLQVMFSVQEIHAFITDGGAPGDFLDHLRDSGVEVIQVGGDGSVRR